MKLSQFKSLVKSGYLKLYLIAKMVLKNGKPSLSVEVRIGSSHTKLEAEAWEEMLLEYPLKDGWRSHNIVAAIIDINRLTSSLDPHKLYAVTIAYKTNGNWNNHLHWLLTDNFDEVEEFIKHWPDNNDIFPDNEAFSIVAHPIITLDELTSSIENWKPLLNLLSINQPDQKQISLEEDNLISDKHLIM